MAHTRTYAHRCPCTPRPTHAPALTLDQGPAAVHGARGGRGGAAAGTEAGTEAGGGQGPVLPGPRPGPGAGGSAGLGVSRAGGRAGGWRRLQRSAASWAWGSGWRPAACGGGYVAGSGLEQPPGLGWAACSPLCSHGALHSAARWVRPRGARRAACSVHPPAAHCPRLPSHHAQRTCVFFGLRAGPGRCSTRTCRLVIALLCLLPFGAVQELLEVALFASEGGFDGKGCAPADARACCAVPGYAGAGAPAILFACAKRRGGAVLRPLCPHCLVASAIYVCCLVALQANTRTPLYPLQGTP